MNPNHLMPDEKEIQQNHSAMVRALAKPGADILATLTPEKVDLWHAATGIVTEAGELMDAVKKHVIYNKPLDLGNVIEELGDLEFYLQQFRSNASVRVNRIETLEHNLDKLAERYKNCQYSDQAAQARADKWCPVTLGAGPARCLKSEGHDGSHQFD